MERAKEGRGQEIFIDTGGDAHIVRPERGAERMRREVLTPACEVVAQSRNELEAEGQLPVVIERLVQTSRISRPRTWRNSLHEWHKSGSQFGKEWTNLRHRHAGFVFLEECVVGMFGIAILLGRSALQFEDACNVWRKQRPIGNGTGLLPGCAGHALRAGHFGHKIGSQLTRSLVISPRNCSQSTTMVVILHGDEHFTQLIGSCPFMNHRAKRSHLLGTRGRTTARHIRLLIPSQYA
jgi:hypothetical protein